jgi:hypothetical protein
MAEVWVLSEGIRFIISNSEEAISGSRVPFSTFSRDKSILREARDA